MSQPQDAARTARVLRAARAQVVASTRPEPYPGHKSALLADYDEQIRHYEARARGEPSVLRPRFGGTDPVLPARQPPRT